MSKKFLTVTLSGVMTVIMAVSAIAGLVTSTKTYDSTIEVAGVVEWNTGGSGELYAITQNSRIVVIYNDSAVFLII